MKKLGKFQSFGFNSFKGLPKDAHLGSLFQREPQKASDVMVQLLAYTNTSSLESFLAKFPTKEFQDDTEFYWDVIASASRNIPLIEARDENGNPVANSNVGAGVTPFTLVFGEDWFSDGEVIVGELNEKYLFRIKGDARVEGTNYAYTVELMGGNTEGVPADRLQAGERFSIEYAPVEQELSRKVGDIHFTSPVAMRNEWTTLRLQHKEAGNKLGRKLAFGIPVVKQDAKGNQVHDTSNMWMHYIDYQFALEWSEMKNKALAFGRSNRNANGEYLNFGKSGNVIKMGDGVFAQAEAGDVRYYNDTSTVMTKILTALYDLSSGKIPFGKRKFIIKTGEMGARLFNEAAKQTTSGWMPLAIYSDGNPATMTKVQSDFAPNNAVRVNDYQVTEWVAPMGVEVKLDVDTFYDDKVRNKIVHPEGGVAFSYRFDIWYVGDEERPNIQKAAIAGVPEQWGYQWGFRNPFTGQQGNANMSYDEDSAVMHKMATLGAIVWDPTRMISIIPSVLA